LHRGSNTQHLTRLASLLHARKLARTQAWSTCWTNI